MFLFKHDALKRREKWWNHHCKEQRQQVKNTNLIFLRKSEKTRSRSNDGDFSDGGRGTEFSERLLKLTMEAGRRSRSLQNHRCSDTDRRERTCRLSTAFTSRRRNITRGFRFWQGALEMEAASLLQIWQSDHDCYQQHPRLDDLPSEEKIGFINDVLHINRALAETSW